MGSKGEGKAEYAVLVMPCAASIGVGSIPMWTQTHTTFDLDYAKKLVDYARNQGAKAKIMIRTVTEWCDITGPYGAGEGTAAESEKEGA